MNTEHPDKGADSLLVKSPKDSSMPIAAKVLDKAFPKLFAQVDVVPAGQDDQLSLVLVGRVTASVAACTPSGSKLGYCCGKVFVASSSMHCGPKSDRCTAISVSQGQQQIKIL